MTRAFVIRGFGIKKDSAGQEIDFDQVHAQLIVPAMERCGLAGGTTAEVVDPGNIRADMFALILEADVVICDITVHNANVFYELGVRHALRKKHTVMIKGDISKDVTPFDLSTDRYLKYEVADPAAAVDELVASIQAGQRSNRATDSPIFLMMPALPEADPDRVTPVPPNFIADVERAAKSKAKAWLRVIAQDLAGQRFQWAGLRRVAQAQWNLKDWDGARHSWETLLRANGGDLQAHLALANIYERQYRDDPNEALLEASHQAIRDVLETDRASLAQRAEALALEGRNQKTLWRARLKGLADPAIALTVALDPRVRQSYDAYRKAFYCDLNAFYPGLAALQMGHIVRLLAALPSWRNLFKGNKKEADRAREDLDIELPALAHVVAASIQRAIKQDPEDRWARIADADHLFLTMPDEELQADHSVLVQTYRGAVPDDDPFAYDAMSGQLGLFAQLGLRAAAVQSILQAFATPDQKPDDERKSRLPKPQHLVVFAGHGIDAPGKPPRFPPSAEAKARALIAARLQALQHAAGDTEDLVVLASAAPGADILAHEVCDELQLACRLCLPMPADAVAQQVFPEADHWRRRFLAIVKARQQGLLQLSIDADLPPWLKGRPSIDTWQRGNRWVMELAQCWGAERITLVVLWDGQDDGKTGGTAHMVRLAKAMPRFVIDVIDSQQLLAP